MTDYKTIKGQSVKVLSADPSPVYTGQMWYNTTDNALNVNKLVETWTEGNNLNTARKTCPGTSNGAQTAALAVDGAGAPNPGKFSEEYDGTSWAEGGDTNTSKQNHAGFGTQTAALIFVTGTSEEYDGSSYTEGTDLNTSRNTLAGFGTQTAGVGCGGYAPTSNLGETEEYNGASWAESGDFNTARATHGAAGTQTAGLAAGHHSQGTNSEEYNGTGWTAGNTLNEGRYHLAMFGIQTAAIVAGGLDANASPDQLDTVEIYDGTSWATGTSFNTARGQVPGDGSASAGLIWGGVTEEVVDNSEEWSSAAATQEITSS